MKIKVAIDGPAGSGKSTISKIVSEEINFEHIDTGAMYRAITLEALNKNINLENEEDYNFLEQTDIKLENKKVYLNNEDVTEEVRTREVSKNVSKVAKIVKVRDELKRLQQEIAKKGNVILDGRDIGTNVLKDAEVKIYLTASVEERANRRHLENKERGIDVSLEELMEDIKKRDYEDENREYAPLKQADDAIFLDTTKMSKDEVINKIVKIINEKR